MSVDASLIDLYQEIILRHNKTPCRKQHVPEGWVQAEGRNPTCGDEVIVGLKLGEYNQLVENSCFHGASCAICTASASMLVERLQGLTLEMTRENSVRVQESLRGGEPLSEEADGDLVALNGVQHFPVRLKCAALPWEVLDKLLNELEEK